MQIDLKVKHQRILGVQQIPRLVVEKTTGFVYLNLEFDEEWDGCSITVLFSNDLRSGKPVAVVWTGEPMEVPSEVLVTGELRISCVGLETDDLGETVQRLTTKRMVDGVRIHAAGEQSGCDPGSSVPGLWEQVLAIMGPLQNLETEDKSSVVGAVNEILGRSIVSMEQTVFAERDNGVNEFTITQADGVKTVLQVKNGSKGPRGAAFTYEDFTAEQLEKLRGPKGDPFRYEDFTPEQLDKLRGPKGSDIQGIDRTAGNGAPGTTDTYTVTLTDGNTHKFYVYNGKDGEDTGDMRVDTYDPTGKRTDVFKYVDNAVKNIPTPDVSGQIGAHNTATDSHNDLRLLITELTNRLNALANSEDVDLDQMAELVAYIKDNRELIEQITTGKVSVTDIVDNLTTNVSNKPLSAAQGVALKSLVDAAQSKANEAADKKVVKSMTYNAAANNWTVTYTDNTTETVAGPALFSGKYSDLSGVPSTFAPSAHNHDASDINSGTLSIDRLPVTEIASVLGAAQVASGSFNGNGSQTLTLTFPFVPKLVIIHISNGNSYPGGVLIYSGGTSAMALASKSGSPTGTLWKVTQSGKSVSFVTAIYTSALSINASGTLHCWVALG